MRNPIWNRDELILALELYFREPQARGSKTHPECAKLSALLNSLPFHREGRGDTFRNANGVGMKLSNFLRYDETYKGRGLSAGSQLEEEVWNTFAKDIPRLRATAAAIEAGAKELSDEGVRIDADQEVEAEEGRILAVVHQRRERSGKLPVQKKQRVLKEKGTLACEICSFDFAAVYGSLGDGFAECHHDKPVSSLKAGEKTKLVDLRIVCANCHRMLHRRRPWITVDALRDALVGGQHDRSAARGPI
jgi:5-methylcytosine-specific restriction protein A